MAILKKFIADSRGLETVEWAVMGALIVAGLILVIAGLGNNIENRFDGLKNATTTP